MSADEDCQQHHRYLRISPPKRPSAFDIPGLACTELTEDEICTLPSEFARTARMAKDAGFGGAQIHAAHGFLLSQFLSPLFDKRGNAYGGNNKGIMRLLLEVADGVRSAVGPKFPVAVKLNATDLPEDGFGEDNIHSVNAALDGTGIDLIDISGGTYFPGAKSACDRMGGGPKSR